MPKLPFTSTPLRLLPGCALATPLKKAVSPASCRPFPLASLNMVPVMASGGKQGSVVEHKTGVNPRIFDEGDNPRGTLGRQLMEFPEHLRSINELDRVGKQVSVLFLQLSSSSVFGN